MRKKLAVTAALAAGDLVDKFPDAHTLFALFLLEGGGDMCKCFLSKIRDLSFLRLYRCSIDYVADSKKKGTGSYFRLLTLNLLSIKRPLFLFYGVKAR